VVGSRSPSYVVGTWCEAYASQLSPKTWMHYRQLLNKHILPALGPQSASSRFHRLIAGGESGARHRRVDIDWIRALRDRCGEQSVAFFKQWGGHRLKSGGRELDGRTHNGYPAFAAA
jgi:hypothetical protein